MNNKIFFKGANADRFLYECGISAYDDHIILELESGDFITLNTEDSIRFLSENSISLYEDYIVLEGEQAEAYKKRKAEEAAKQKQDEKDRDKRRYLVKDPDALFYMYKPAGAQKTYSGFSKDTQYKGSGDRNEFIFTSKEDGDRRKKTNEILNKEKDRREREWDNARDRRDNYYDSASKAIEKNNPGGRPTGIFKSSQKKQWDKDYSRYKGQIDERDRHHAELDKEVNKARDQYYAARSKDADSAVNRHIRRHPEQYKESTNIFSSIKFV